MRSPTRALLVGISIPVLLLLSPELPAQKPAPARSIAVFVDAHCHPEPGDLARSIESALQATNNEDAAKIMFMPPPFGVDDHPRYDADVLLPAIKHHRDKLAVLGGGGTLNPMIQESVRTGDTGPEVKQKFRQAAERMLRDGAAGFGEMTAEHFAGGTSYQSVPPDHPLFLLLADIAAEHDVPIVLHMEAVPQDMALPAPLKSPPNPPQLRANLEAFGRLLAHNVTAKIVWAHAGWDNTGYRTPELCSRLLRKYPNLYMDLKIDPAKPGKNSPLVGGARGAVKPEWLKLFRDFPDRFVIGSDQHYPEPLPGPQRWEAVVQLLNQLPDGVRQKIAKENAERLYRLKP